MLCMRKPTDKKAIQIFRPVNGNQMFGALGNPKARPWTITLDDGSVCTVRLGGAWSIPPKGYFYTYGCTGPVGGLLTPGDGDTLGATLNTSSAHWTVHATKYIANDQPVIVVGVKSVVYAGATPFVAPAKTGSGCPSAAQLQAVVAKGFTVYKGANAIRCSGSWASATVIGDSEYSSPAAFQLIGGRWQQAKRNSFCALPGPLPAALYSGTCNAG